MPSPNQYRIAVAARKRGVGKTTIACGLALVILVYPRYFKR